MDNPKLTIITAAILFLSQILATAGYGQLVAEVNRPDQPVNTSGKEINYSKYIRDLTQLAGEGKLGFTFGLEGETGKLEKALSATSKGVIIIGRQGNEGSLVVDNLALRSAESGAAQNLSGKRILSIDLSSLLAEAENPETLATRLQTALSQVADDDSVLFVDQASVFSGANPVFGASVSRILRQAITLGNIRIVSSADAESYQS